MDSGHTSPNFSTEVIPVEFVVIHYTACDLKGALRIFSDPARKVCAHFVLDRDGTVYDLGGFLNGPVRKGAHAGESRIDLDGRIYSSLNSMSVGVELVNLNGNLLTYPDVQYAALTELLRHLISRFPALSRPGRLIGHEHIAGFRGKCDPGIQFDWPRVLGALGLPVLDQHRRTHFTSDDLRMVHALVADRLADDGEFWSNLSRALEERVKARQSQPDRGGLT